MEMFLPFAVLFLINVSWTGSPCLRCVCLVAALDVQPVHYIALNQLCVQKEVRFLLYFSGDRQHLDVYKLCCFVREMCIWFIQFYNFILHNFCLSIFSDVWAVCSMKNKQQQKKIRIFSNFNNYGHNITIICLQVWKKVHPVIFQQTYFPICLVSALSFPVRQRCLINLTILLIYQIQLSLVLTQDPYLIYYSCHPFS